MRNVPFISFLSLRDTGYRVVCELQTRCYSYWYESRNCVNADISRLLLRCRVCR